MIVQGAAFAASDRVPPASVPIALDREGVAATLDLTIREHLPYTFCLRFAFPEKDQAERARLRRLLGGHATGKDGRPLEPGVPTPVRLSLTRPGENRTYEVSVDPMLTSWGAGNFKKCLGHCDLPPGKYQVTLLNMRSATEFHLTPIALTVGMDKFKSSFVPRTPGRSQSCLPL